MRHPRTAPLRPGQSADPLARLDPAPRVPPPPDLARTLALVFADAPKSARLRSWDHAEAGDRVLYWIAARGTVGLHTDPGFARWQHQLVIRNDGYAIVGIGRDLPPEPLRPGDLYRLDAHSPHALVRDRRAGAGGFFVAVGMAGDPADPAAVRAILERFRDRGRRRP